METQPLNMFVVKVQSLECFSSCYAWDTTNVFYFLWFASTAALTQWHASRRTGVDSALTALSVCSLACTASLVHSHILNVEEPLPGHWIILWLFSCFTVCWIISQMHLVEGETISNKTALYTKARSLLVLPKRGAVIKDLRPETERPYYEAIRKMAATEQTPQGKPLIFSRLRLTWFATTLMAMFLLKHELHVDLFDLVVWLAFATLSAWAERFLGLKSLFLKNIRRFKPTYDARSPWRVDDSLLPPQSEGFTPLLVFVNPSSGGNLGEILLEQVEALDLNEVQVWNMSWKKNPIHAFRPFDDSLRKGRKLRVLVCGGDGTVAWVLGPTGIGALPEELRKLVAIAVLPLGTGNDLARALGWGGGYTADINKLIWLLGELPRANEVLLDRWVVSATNLPHRRRRYRRKNSAKKSKQWLMNNYIGFGCGAQVSLNFHTRRNKCKWLFQNQYFNKLVYALIGGHQVLKHVVHTNKEESFSKSIRLSCDGVALDLEGFEGIIILNIPSYGGGLNVWASAEDVQPPSPVLMSMSQRNATSDASDDVRKSSRRPRRCSDNSNRATQSFNDGRLEVVGVRMVHLAVGHVGLPTGERLSQCANIDIELLRHVPMQVDGEPELLPKGAKISIKLDSKAWMCQRSTILTHTNASLLRSVFHWGEAQGVLTPEQCKSLDGELNRRVMEAEKIL